MTHHERSPRPLLFLIILAIVIVAAVLVAR